MANNTPTIECKDCHGRGYVGIYGYRHPTWREPDGYESCETCDGSGEIDNEDYDPDEPSDETEALYAAANGMLASLGHDPITPRRDDEAKS